MLINVNWLSSYLATSEKKTKKKNRLILSSVNVIF